MPTNRLIYEQSPYLLQHAHNPVDWYPWSLETLQKAQQEDKPIILSIGYAACHWCHVMERESFENEEIAAFMNEHFINVKVDREERPDLDHIYMEAVQAIAGSGGWPLNCFLLPDGRPAYGGTYFPPEPLYHRPSWMQLLKWFAKNFKQRRAELEKQANRLTYHVAQQEKTLFQTQLFNVNYSQPFTTDQGELIFKLMATRFDAEDGGFGGAPKFPSTFALHFLLCYHHHTGNRRALEHALFSIDRMIFGGIYDQLGGGFARYTVDKIWLVPHFEKMLYDNALLVQLLVDAYKITGYPCYQEAIEQTLAFVARDMTSSTNGFFASYDADSEGEEGKFYVWQKSEIDAILGKNAPIFNHFYGVTPEGNWEHTNILHRKHDYETFAKRHHWQTEELKKTLKNCRQRLFLHREKRVKPALDDKIILSWNAMMVSAYCKAYQALENETYKQAAIKNITFLLQAFRQQPDTDNWALHHTYKNGKAQYPAFLDDYALLIEALILVYEITLDGQYLQTAQLLTNYIIAHFSDAKNLLFYYTPDNQIDILLRKKEAYDGATPSGNSTMAINLYKMGIITGEYTYINRAIDMLKSAEGTITKLPTSFAKWASLLLHLTYDFHEIAIVGKEAKTLGKQIQKLFLPNKVLLTADTQEQTATYPLLKNRWINGETLLYACQNFSCRMPVKTVDDFKEQLSAKRAFD